VRKPLIGGLARDEQATRPIEFKRRVVAEEFVPIRKEKQVPRFARNDNFGCGCE